MTLAPGATANVTYTVTATPTGSVDSNWGVSGHITMLEEMFPQPDPAPIVNTVNVTVHPDEVAAAVACVPSPFPVDLDTNSLNCDYSAPLPDASGPREAHMRPTQVNGNVRNVKTAFDFSNPTVNLVDESVTVTDTMGGTLGTVNAADGPKTFTYTKTIGPYTAAQCGSKTVDNTATYTTVDSATAGSASAAVAVTVTCPPPPPPPPKCALPSLVWKFVGLLGPNYFKTLLPQTLGTAGGPKTVNVTTTLQGMSILFKEWISMNVVDLLATEQLAAKLNAASGRDVSSIAATMAAVDAFLATHNASSYLSYAEKNQVKAWTVTLEKYNNQCIPDIGHDTDNRCGSHWDKAGHDWHKWNWQGVRLGRLAHPVLRSARSPARAGLRRFRGCRILARMADRLRVTLCPVNTAGVPWTNAEALRRRGVDARLVVFERYKLHPEADESLEIPSNSLLLRRQARQWAALARLLPRTDVFHFHFGLTLVPQSLQFPILRAARKKSVMHYLGSDIRGKTPEQLAYGKKADAEIVGSYDAIRWVPEAEVIPPGVDLSRIEPVPPSDRSGR